MFVNNKIIISKCRLGRSQSGLFAHRKSALLIWQGECRHLQEGDVPGKGVPVFVLSVAIVKWSPTKAVMLLMGSNKLWFTQIKTILRWEWQCRSVPLTFALTPGRPWERPYHASICWLTLGHNLAQYLGKKRFSGSNSVCGVAAFVRPSQQDGNFNFPTCWKRWVTYSTQHLGCHHPISPCKSVGHWGRSG